MKKCLIGLMCGSTGVWAANGLCKIGTINTEIPVLLWCIIAISFSFLCLYLHINLK